MELVPDVGIFAAVVAVVVSTSLIKLPWWSEKAKVVAASVVSVVAASAQAMLSGGFDPSDIVNSSLQVFGGSQILYRLIMDRTELDDKLEAVFAHRDEA
jgi:hypothetical protein